MTSYSEEFKVTRKCLVCGTVTSFKERYLMSYHRWDESMYLDTRSYEDMGPSYEVCPKCGYIAGDISGPAELQDEIRKIVERPEYKSGFPFFENKTPFMYRRFLIDYGLHNYDDAYRSLLLYYMSIDNHTRYLGLRINGAYVRDSAQIDYIRYLLISLLRDECKDASDGYKNDLLIQIVDLYRRGGYFEEAERILNRSFIRGLLSKAELRSIKDELLDMREKGEKLTPEIARELIDKKKNNKDEKKKATVDFPYSGENTALMWAREQLGYQTELSDGELGKIIEFERKRIEDCDRDKYSVAEALSGLERNYEKLLGEGSCLTEREQKVIRKLHGIGEDKKPIEEVSSEMELTKERIRYIETKAMRKLRCVGGGGGVTIFAEWSSDFEETDEVCEKCGRPMLLKHGKFGDFLACSGYPECRNAKKLPQKEIGVKCPECGSLLVEKKGEKSIVECSNSECNYRE